jgi:hypothetical protein
MSIEATRQWIQAHKRKEDAVARWNGALEDTRVCAAEASRQSGFAAANAYYNCRNGKKLTKLGLFVAPPF